MTYWVTAYLGLGANVPTETSPDRQLAAACKALAATPTIVVRKISSLYRSAPWGGIDQPDFFNAAVEIETLLGARELLDTVKRIERELGRIPTYRWGPRVIDIDILLYGRESIDEPDLVIPHPYLLERPFAYLPLLEIAPEASWPTGQCVRELVRGTVADEINVTKLGELPQ